MKPRIHHCINKSTPTDPILRQSKRDDEFKNTSYTTKAFFTAVTELTNNVLWTIEELKVKLWSLFWQHKERNRDYCSKE
jgi:hypothetical protein